MRLSLLLFIPFLLQCSRPQPETSRSSAACSEGNPDIGYYFESTPGENPITQKFVATVQDQSCTKRRVLFQGCGPEAIKTLFGYTTTAPRLLTEAEILNFEQNDETTLPAFSCSSDIEPLRDERSRPVAVHIVSGKNGYGALRIANPLDTRPAYAIVPNECFTLGRKLQTTRWAAQLEHPEDAIEKPYIPAADDLALRFSCAHEKAPAASKEGWNFGRVYVDDARTIYSLRYVSKEAHRNISMLIYRLDGLEPENFTDELKTKFEAHMAARLGVKVQDIAQEPLGSPDESTLIMDYCLDQCGNVQPDPIDGLGNALLPASLGESRFHWKPLANPFLENGRFLELSGQRALDFASCDAADDDLAQRLGFLPGPTDADTWENRLRKGAESNGSLKITRVPCFKKRASCVRPIPAGTNLSASMTSTPGSVSSYVNKTGTCARASELELFLEGDVEVKGNAFTLGNSSLTQFSKITLSGNPGARIKLNIDCTRITCDAQTFAAVQILPNTVVELKGLRFTTVHNTAKVKTIAVRSTGTHATAALFLNGVTILGENAAEQDYHTGLWLEDASTYASGLKIQAAYEAVHATRGRLSLIGKRKVGQVRADDTLGLSLRRNPDASIRVPGPELLRVLKLSDVQTFIYAAQLNGPTGMELQSTAAQLGTTTAWYADISNGYAPYRDYAVGLLTRGPHVAQFSFPWIHDTTRLINFGGSRLDKPRLDFRGIVEDSFVMDREIPIENAALGYFNQLLGIDQDICRNAADEETCIL